MAHIGAHIARIKGNPLESRFGLSRMWSAQRRRKSVCKTKLKSILPGFFLMANVLEANRVLKNWLERAGAPFQNQKKGRKIKMRFLFIKFFMALQEQITQKKKLFDFEKADKDGLIMACTLLAIALLAGWLAISQSATQFTSQKSVQQSAEVSGASGKTGDELKALEEKVLPPEGMTLPVRWGDIGRRLIDTGVIDAEKFEQLYAQRGGLTEEEKQLLYGENNGNLKINAQNSGFLLNLLWAFGLGNKNSILEQGPMTDPQYGGDASKFASTGGWTLAKGEVMNHYSKHMFVSLTSEQQQMVERVAKGIYRPCCGNSTYFPDCNHGMAMLGLLELMAAQGIGEEEMYNVALKVNSYWFPDTYLAIAQYLAQKGIKWDEADPKEILGVNFSSAQGFQQILQEVRPIQRNGGGGCGV
jgi:hypothetical protein